MKPKPVIETIRVKHLVDENADLSWLKSTIDASGKLHSCRYTQDELQQHPRRTRRYMAEDKARLDNYGNTWGMMGIMAEATVKYPIGQGNWRLETLTSGGIWGVETDSDNHYIQQLEHEELADLKSHLQTFNVSVRGFGHIPIEHKNEA